MDSLIFLLTFIVILALLNINKVSKLTLIRYIYLKYMLPKLKEDALRVTLNVDVLKILEQGVKRNLYTKVGISYFIDYTLVTTFYLDRIIKSIEYDPVWSKIIIRTVDSYDYAMYIDHYLNQYIKHLIEYHDLLKLRKNYVREIND